MEPIYGFQNVESVHCNSASKQYISASVVTKLYMLASFVSLTTMIWQEKDYISCSLSWRTSKQILDSGNLDMVGDLKNLDHI